MSVHVPTVEELVKLNLAQPINGSSPRAYRISEEGQRRILEAQTAAALEWRRDNPHADEPPAPRARTFNVMDEESWYRKSEEEPDG